MAAASAMVLVRRLKGAPRPMPAGPQGIPSVRVLAALVASAVFGQVAGNVANQWSLSVVGLALNVPLTFGALIIWGATLGWCWLGERVTPRTAMAMLVLLAAVPVFRGGADDAYRTVAGPSGSRGGPLLLTLGVAAACLSGVAYATQAAVIRRVVQGLVPLPHTLLVFSGTGVVGLGLFSLAEIGPEGIAGTTSTDLAVMFAAGAFNAAGFFALGKSLQYVPVARVNLLNASQTAMAALAGAILFGESFTWPVLAGILLTIAGLVLMDRS
jgi:drug/metabolite transporter (DMT)-like permease